MVVDVDCGVLDGPGVCCTGKDTWTGMKSPADCAVDDAVVVEEDVVVVAST